MNLAIVGYGKMGRLLHELAPEYDMQVRLTLDEASNRNGEGITPEAFAEVDVAIEFSNPEAVVTNLVKLAGTGVGIVVGTTGWTDHLPQVRSAVAAGNAGLVWSPNFSIGVNVFFRLVSQAAQLLATEPQYGSWAWEVHHDSKKDAPSGTLLKLLDEMKSAGYDRPVSASSNRAGRHPGTHEIGFDSSADTITIRHSARSREGFARGALKAAQFIHGRRGVFEFSEVLFGGVQ